MDGLSILQQYYPEILPGLNDPPPFTDSSIRLYLSTLRIGYSFLYPFYFYVSTIRPLPHVTEIFGKFHFPFLIP